MFKKCEFVYDEEGNVIDKVFFYEDCVMDFFKQLREKIEKDDKIIMDIEGI